MEPGATGLELGLRNASGEHSGHRNRCSEPLTPPPNSGPRKPHHRRNHSLG
jgi:hypothetical protein